MKVVYFSTNIDIVDEWVKRHSIDNHSACSDINCLLDELDNDTDTIIVADYDTTAHTINSLISTSSVPNNLIILEKAPELITGKMLIRNHIKAYGNSRMLAHHYAQMIEVVNDGNIWTYPELTSALVKVTDKLSDDAIELINHRLSQKEKEVIYLLLDGLTTDTMATSLDITARTVKAHISSIFDKLHVNDRVSLILLLK